MHSSPTSSRWDALDVLRGLTIILMLMNLAPGSWAHNYAPLVHAQWEGWTLIDMVAPAFLFCIGVAMPLSFARRSARGDSRETLLWHVITRGLALVAIGFFLNLYPKFDFATVRIPGVLQRIGLCYLLSGVFILLVARRATSGGLQFPARVIAAVAAFVLLSYWALLYFVPVPGFGAPRFDPVGSWPSVIDRAVIGVEHFFPHFPVDGKVVFDPEGILSTWPACFNVLLGVLVGITFARGRFAWPAATAIAMGAMFMLLALAAQAFCPLIKNLWTSSFALFSGGFALLALGLLMPVSQQPVIGGIFWPARIFGENPLLAYILCFLIAPLVDLGLRDAGQAWFERFLAPNAASLAFGTCGVVAIYALLLVCHRRRWILKL